MTDQCSARRRFARLHRDSDGFVMPNVSDAGSAILVQLAGFAAIGTSSAGIAFSLGRTDYALDRSRTVSREQMFGRIAEIVSVAKVPVNGDLEHGYGDEPEDVADTVRMAIAAGLAGCNIEDRLPAQPELYQRALAVERIRAAADAAEGTDFVLTARTDALIWSESGMREAIERSNLYLEAGASCAFTPGVSDIDAIAELAREINGPLNMVMGLGSTRGRVADWLAVGIRRISTGGAITRTMLGTARAAADELAREGTVGFATNQIQQADLNETFERFLAPASGDG